MYKNALTNAILNITVLKKVLLCLLTGVWSTGVILANNELPKDSTKATITSSPSSASGAKDSQQASSENKPAATITKSGPKVRFSGFMRMVGFSRYMEQYYSDISTDRGLTFPWTVNIGDGSGNPLLMWRLETNPTAKTSILVESSLHSPFLSNGGTNDVLGTQSNASNPIYPGNIASIFARFALNATSVTDFATIKLQAGGGANWGKMSPFTLWTFQYRDDMFERYPWDPAGSNWNRYNSVYATGDIPRDLRWGRRAIQGFKIGLEDLPHGFEGMFFFGKTSISGSYQSYLRQDPQNNIAFRVAKKVGGHKFGFNYFDQYGYTSAAAVNVIDSVGGTPYTVKANRTNQGSSTVDALFNIPGKFRIYSEVGLGWYRSNRSNAGTKDSWKEGEDATNYYKKNISPVAYVEVEWKSAPFFNKFKTSAFFAGRHAVNNASALLNSSNEGATNGRDFQDLGAGNDNVFYLEGMVTEIGQITNNRAGWNINLTKNFKKLVVEFGLGIQQEIEKVYQDTTVNGGRLNSTPAADIANGEAFNGVRNSVTLYHIANQYNRSRFKYNVRGYGPYGRLLADYRRAWENIAITDENPDYFKKYFMLDLGFKYKLQVAKKDLILTAFGRANAVSDKYNFSFFSNQAFVRQYFEEFMFFYHLHPKFTVIGLLNFEQVYGNNRTEMADAEGNTISDPTADNPNLPVFREDGNPISQSGTGYGIGCDWDFTSRACISTRYRYYTHKDKYFLADKFSGHELSCEFKLFF